MNSHLLTPRDWQAGALARAAKYTGTDEGALALVEANRYGALADELERCKVAQDMNSRLAYELQGVLADVRAGNGFDATCQATVAYVMNKLRENNT